MDKILLGHGSGGILMHRLIEEIVAPMFNLTDFNDSAIIGLNSNERLAYTTDSYVVSPLFFPGGNIGDLAINGTINDLAVMGAEPICLTVGLILEEGLPIETLKTVLQSMSEAARVAGVKVVAGDTKVVDKGKCDGMYINTSGIGVIKDAIDIGVHKIESGDKVITSGMIGNHGIAVMSKRHGLVFEPPVETDSAPLNLLTREILSYHAHIKMMRDPTRGGIATTLKEIALQSGHDIEIDEERLPIPQGVVGACELLGLDPLYVANEGILVAIVSDVKAEDVLSKMRANPLGKDAQIIGEVKGKVVERKPKVVLNTLIGGKRIIDMLTGEQLTRIC
ncbi:MAG: hydrogenase expression/formation protein HypE [Thermodesulfovibrionales bacterium]|nr:hydrogenase expression/formation protein HypE [Thermodesulfovibrionales bacterium]